MTFNDWWMKDSFPRNSPRDLAQAAWEVALAQRPQEPRILDEREVMALAKKAGLPKYMDDTEAARMALARFAHQVRLDMNIGGDSNGR